MAGLVPGGDNGVTNVYRRQRGAPIAILQSVVTQSGSGGQLSGIASFAGAVISAAVHPSEPQPAIDMPGGYIASAELIVRPELEDLRLRVVVPTLPSVQVSGLAGRLACFEVGCPPSVTNSPYVGYRLDFSLAGVPYRIVMNGSGAVLQNCTAACLPVGVVPLQVGVTGTEVIVTVPLSMLGAAAGAPVTGIVVTSTLLVSAAPSQDVDSIALPNTALSGPVVRFGIAPPDVSAEAVNYTGTTVPNAGAFTTTFVGSADGSAVVLWAKPCIGATCGAAMSWPLAAAPPVQLNAVVSRQIHGGASAFDVDLPLDGSGIECRSGGANGDYQLVFTFANPLTNVDLARVSSGTGSVTSSATGADPHQYIVNLTGISNAQRITVSLTNVSDSVGHRSSSVSTSMGVLIGDVNASGVVTTGDTNLCKAQALQTVATANFRNDINASGAITTGDVNIIKQNALNSLP